MRWLEIDKQKYFKTLEKIRNQRKKIFQNDIIWKLSRKQDENLKSEKKTNK